ncbi:MAG: NRDE family protein [Myxococcota bacterium]
MCTLVAFHAVHPAAPLVVAANRDEFHARASLPPEVLHEVPRVVAGRDAEKGGTWLGVCSSGFFVGLTNQREWAAKPQEALRSRGDVTLEALRRGSVDGVHALLDTLDTRSLAGFNLLYGDGRSLHVAYARPGERVERQALPPGVHVLTNDRLGSPHFPKARRAERLARGALAATCEAPLSGLLTRLESLLADAELPPLEEVPEPPPGARVDRALARRLQALCIETPVYGTVSATLLALAPGTVRAHRFADGAPGRVPFVDVTGLHEGPPPPSRA